MGVVQYSSNVSLHFKRLSQFSTICCCCCHWIFSFNSMCSKCYRCWWQFTGKYLFEWSITLGVFHIPNLVVSTFLPYHTTCFVWAYIHVRPHVYFVQNACLQRILWNIFIVQMKIKFFLRVIWSSYPEVLMFLTPTCHLPLPQDTYWIELYQIVL